MIKKIITGFALLGLSSLSFAGTFSIDPPEILNGALTTLDGGFANCPAPSYPLDFQYGAVCHAAASNSAEGFTPLVSCWVRWKVKWLQSGTEAAPTSGLLNVQTWGHAVAGAGGFNLGMTCLSDATQRSTTITYRTGLPATT